MCEFCDGSHKKVELNVSGTGWGTTSQNTRAMEGAFLPKEEHPPVDYIYLDDPSLLMAQTSSGEYRDLGVLIHYCPFCGRKLV